MADHGTRTYKFAYYCSGHGFGHATRVTAISLELISSGHTVHVITSAPRSVFEPLLGHPTSRGSYRFAQIEPTMVQPKAYDVDCTATFKNLDRFIRSDRIRVVNEEARWLSQECIDCVLVDAPFVACAAAKQVRIRSVIISNFTFCSCYSYLSVFDPFQDAESIPDSETGPVQAQLLAPLVNVAIADYAKADLLLRLPGAIPIPGFDTDVELPATRWVDHSTRSFRPHIHDLLDRPTSTVPKQVVWDMPLVVRPISAGIYQPHRRLELLKRLGVAESLQMVETKILLVSFGGQSIPRPQTNSSSSNISTLLPPGWIAIVCGSSADHLAAQDAPDRFYPIPQSSSYVPDLTALADVVLGKLGYGTCSESLATRTPFIYVPRPMFVEEYGLKRLMREVANVEMSRDDFEHGRWAEKVSEAYHLGHSIKQAFIRSQSQTEISSDLSTRKVVEALERFLDIEVGMLADGHFLTTQNVAQAPMEAMSCS